METLFFGGLEKLSNLYLRQPRGFAIDAQIESGLAVVGSVEDQLAHDLAFFSAVVISV